MVVDKSPVISTRGEASTRKYWAAHTIDAKVQSAHLSPGRGGPGERDGERKGLRVVLRMYVSTHVYVLAFPR